MTEEQAKTKWCPMSRTGVDEVTANRGFNGKIFEEDKCIASDCMMWRWLSWKPKGLTTWEIEFDKEAGGYCGLAGKR